MRPDYTPIIICLKCVEVANTFNRTKDLKTTAQQLLLVSLLMAWLTGSWLGAAAGRHHPAWRQSIFHRLWARDKVKIQNMVSFEWVSLSHDGKAKISWQPWHRGSWCICSLEGEVSHKNSLTINYLWKTHRKPLSSHCVTRFWKQLQQQQGKCWVSTQQKNSVK